MFLSQQEAQDRIDHSPLKALVSALRAENSSTQESNNAPQTTDGGPNRDTGTAGRESRAGTGSEFTVPDATGNSTAADSTIRLHNNKVGNISLRGLGLVTSEKRGPANNTGDIRTK